uniref:ZP domain-containing protein n=1 Tax=Steinernema glaseri TaxID=37863 RepID=A0A1I8AM86_9BILA
MLLLFMSFMSNFEAIVRLNLKEKNQLLSSYRGGISQEYSLQATSPSCAQIPRWGSNSTEMSTLEDAYSPAGWSEIQCVFSTTLLLTSMRNRFEVPLNSLTCGVKASKKNPPPGGMEYSVNIVLSYNHMYLTEDDLMYNVKCSYPSAEKAVGTMYEASLLPRASAVGEIAAPVCNYSLHMGSLNGPSPSTALIGQKVYHKWQCNTQDFSLKVYRCYVHNGQQKKYLLVDDEGCSLDPSILPELVYDRELNYVYATSSVFRFTDTSKVYFNCLLYMCPKGEPSCQKNIPPKCYSSGLKRGRRASKFPENLTIERNHHAIIVQSPSLQQNIDEEEDRAIARCELAFYSRAAFVTLVVSNFLSLAIASFAVLYVYRRHFSAQLDIQ